MTVGQTITLAGVMPAESLPSNALAIGIYTSWEMY